MSDTAVGFSGSTNCVIAFDNTDTILDIRIASSGDTRDHVELIESNRTFLNQWKGKHRSELTKAADVKSVAGATLTSTAIMQGIQRRLGARVTVSKFPAQPALEHVQALFPGCTQLDSAQSYSGVWTATDSQGKELGWILRTSPVSDNIIGYQGPTDTLIGFSTDGNVLGVHISDSFDNEPYVGYVRQDASFGEHWKKYRWPGLEKTDLREEGIEGVSGATMTSMAIAEGILSTAKAYRDSQEVEQSNRLRWIESLKQDSGTLAVTLFGTWFAMSSWRSNRWLRPLFQFVVVGYLGLMQGDLLSIGMWVGWARNGVPWVNSLGLVFLTAAAVLVPMATKHNVYCSHLCPYGAVQQMLPRRWRIKTPHAKWLNGLLWMIRPLLFVWVFCVGLLAVPGNLADIEPFDAFLWRAIAIPSLIVAMLGLLLSLAIPMGYCKHACVTGSVINYLRSGTHKAFWTRSDRFALGFFLLGLAIYWIA
jgi:Na+-translocating ferredoxin:NAD+ oxidoreductase RnfG subunit